MFNLFSSINNILNGLQSFTFFVYYCIMTDSNLLELIPNKTIQNVEHSNKEIILIYDNKKLILNAIGDCCSQSYFQFDDNIDQIKGKQLLEIQKYKHDTSKNHKLFKKYKTKFGSNIDHINVELTDKMILEHFGTIYDIEDKENYLIFHFYTMIFSDGFNFEFVLINFSNGYYDGWIEISEERKIKNLKQINCVIVTIIIGFPGSGKTHLGHTLTEEYISTGKIAKLYDDILSDTCLDLQHDDFTKDFDFDIRYDNRIIINDARFCNQDVFKRFMKKTLSIFPIENIDLILFENDPTTCINNIKKREKEKQDSFINFIIKYKNSYDPTSNVYNIYNNKIIKCYNDKQ